MQYLLKQESILRERKKNATIVIALEIEIA